MDQKALLRTLTINYGQILVPYIDNYLGAGQFPDKWDVEVPLYKQSDGFFHPSSHCFMPPRDLYLDIKGWTSKIKPSAALNRTFHCGHLWHGYLENVLISMGYVKPSNVELKLKVERTGSHGPFIGSGTADLVDVQIPNKGSWLVDIKTMNKGEFEAGARKYTYMKWEAQVNCYMDWLGVDQAIILAVCKDSPHNMREYKIEKKPELLKEIYERWSYAAECIREDKMPEDNWQPEDPALLIPGDTISDFELVEQMLKNTKPIASDRFKD
jgi:hypothetical protein